MDIHHLESTSFEMGSMGEAQKLCYVVRKHILSNGHLCLPNIHTNTNSDESIKVSGKNHHFGLRHGNKEPKYRLQDISITIQVLKMDLAPLNHVFLALSTSRSVKYAKCHETFCSKMGLTANFSKWEPSFGCGAWKN